MWFKWFWNVYCTRKGSHIHYFEETSDPIHKLDFEAKEKVHPSWNRLLLMKSSYGDSALDMIITICRAFSRLKKKKNLLPEKGPTRVARDAAIVHPPFWDRLQIQIFNISQCQQLYMNFCHFGHLTHIFHLIPDGRQHTQPGWLFGSSSKAGGPSSCSTNCPLALSSNISATIPLWFGCFPSRHLDK